MCTAARCKDLQAGEAGKERKSRLVESWWKWVQMVFCIVFFTH